MWRSHPCFAAVDALCTLSSLDLEENFFTGTVPSSLLYRFGMSKFEGICLNAVGSQRSICDDPYLEQLALLDLFDATNGASWFTSTNWQLGFDSCSFYGVSCVSGRVRWDMKTAYVCACEADLLTITSLCPCPLCSAPLASPPTTWSAHCQRRLLRVTGVDLSNNLIRGSIPSAWA